MDIIQTMTNILSPLLYKRRYSQINNPFLEFEKLKIDINHSCEHKDEGIVLITPLRVSPTSNLLEGLIGSFFMEKGYDVRFLLCDQQLEYCENIPDLKKKKLICSLCKKEQRIFKRVFSANCFHINDYVTNKEIRDIEDEVKRRSFKESKDYNYGGVDLEDEIVAGVMRYTQSSDIDSDKDVNMIRKCARTSFLLSKCIANYLSENKIYKIITSHGIYSSWGAVLKTSQYYKIDSIVWGRGYIGQGALIFGHNKANQDDLRNESSEVFSNIIITDEVKKKVEDYYFKKDKTKDKVDCVNYYEGIEIQDYDTAAFWKKVGTYKKVFGMFTNIPWDGQIFNKTKEFPTTRVYIRSCVEWFKNNPTCLLVMRAHPAEVSRKDSKGVRFRDLLKEEYPELPTNVIFLDADNPITSYELAKHIDYSIMYGSSMAPEIALRKIPVIHVGYTFISNKRIVIDVYDKKDLVEKLEKAKCGELKMTDEMIENAYKYGYYWITSRNVPDTTSNLDKLYFQNYTFSNKEEFMKDPFLNLVFNKIIANERIVLP